MNESFEKLFKVHENLLSYIMINHKNINELQDKLVVV